jgi:hypothetical protein
MRASLAALCLILILLVGCAPLLHEYPQHVRYDPALVERIAAVAKTSQGVFVAEKTRDALRIDVGAPDSVKFDKIGRVNFLNRNGELLLVVGVLDPAAADNERRTRECYTVAQQLLAAARK